MSSNFDFIWKVVIGGAGGVGKTSLLHRYIHREFKEDMKMTIGCQFHTQQLVRQNQNISIVMWDLGGQERFRFIQPEYVRGAAGAIVLFDLSDHRTFDNVTEEWIPLIRNNANPSIPILLVGSKMDLVDEQTYQVMQLEAQRLVEQHKLAGFTTVSSKWNVNVDETILYMVDFLIWQSSQLGKAAGGSEFVA
ncbi:MAG: GTP-binding protein [Candidatus Lokiarchaeota archaeon]|nr:GTP-binding protein [Candidatus Lokiarchaeota archaeon]